MDTAGDHAELTAVIRRFHCRMVAVAGRVLHDEEDARDAVQDAYLQAVFHLHRFDRRGQLSTWLHRIVVNAALMRLRARRRRPTEDLDTDALADDAADVELAVERRQIQALVRRSLAGVTNDQRAVLVLRDMDDRDAAEVARALGVSRGAFKSRSHRARRALRSQLMRIGIGSDGPSAAASRTPWISRDEPGTVAVPRSPA
jgi:RNA polymerase sigma-70 factor, ECF subfamily